LTSASRGHHFARPGNRFWPALHGAGFTPRLLAPDEDALLLEYGLGVTNLVDRPTRAADELSVDELKAGAEALGDLAREYEPAVIAVVGLSAWRLVHGRPNARPGPQPELVGGCRSWLLPNPSGLNAHYQLPDLIRHFADLRRAAVRQPSTGDG
jgi:TDG/mug DNA glycosylase family protein